jgi:hypothetical protein
MKNRIRGALLLGAAMTVVSVSCGSPGPGQTVQKYFESIDKGDIDGTLKLLSMNQTTAPSELTAAKAEVVMLIGVLHEQGGLKSVRILKEKVEGKSAQVDAQLSFNKDKDEDLSYKLVKEPDGWKIEDMLLTPIH